MTEGTKHSPQMPSTPSAASHKISPCSQRNSWSPSKPAILPLKWTRSPLDLVQLMTMILEEALSRPQPRGFSRIRLVTSAMSVLSALLTLSKYSLRVWLYVRSATVLFGPSRSSGFASVALPAERVTGQYTMTLSLLYLVQQLLQRAPEGHEYAYTAANTIKSIGNALLTGKNDDETKAGEPNASLALEKYLSVLFTSFDPSIMSLTLGNALSESPRYLDQHPAVPDDAQPESKEDFDKLHMVLLNNSALAALRTLPPDPNLAVNQTTWAYLQAVKKEHKGLHYSRNITEGSHYCASTRRSC
jgi:hypothetical protein